ncbi:MAG: CBS domain-containing protein [Gammaproteobacteria bacterium]
MDKQKVIALAKAVIDTEAQAAQRLALRIDDSFTSAVDAMLHCEGRIVVIGMGKSGHIGHKLAATLASTGTPAFFVHPGEASHGDLGMITAKDVVVALSNSGETDEILTILPLIKRLKVQREFALLESRGFTEADFALSHPGGRLGKRLLLHVADIMHRGQGIPRVAVEASLSEALAVISSKSLGMTVVVNPDDSVAGVFTDGDLRRLLDHGDVNINKLQIKDVMVADCKTIRPDILAAEALQIMENRRINAFPVVDANNRLVGALSMHDLLRAGVV